MNALPCVKVSKCTGDICSKGHPEAPWERLGLVMDVHAEVSVFDELGYDEDASIWCARETEVKNDVRMARLPGGRQFVGKADYGLDI